MSDKSVFETLSSISTDNKVRKKGQFWYVSWSNAVRELLKHYPSANWEFTQYNGLPYLKTETGVFVECAVTVSGITRKQMMPILNHRNAVEREPDAAMVNKTQMRALTKAIALHGFGLDLWAGEDLDDCEGGVLSVDDCEHAQVETYPEDQFNASFPQWRNVIKEGKKTQQQLIEYLNNKGVVLSDSQIKKINEVK